MNDIADPTRRTYRRFKDGETHWDFSDLHTRIFEGERTYKCPTYVRRTPPCQAICPSGHDIRGWLSIARGIDKPPVAGMPWQEYAFQRMAAANPFPALIGRICPAQCQKSCNRDKADDFIGINSVEHYVGDWALAHKLKLPAPAAATGKSVAVVGSGPAGLSAACYLRLKGHAVTIYEAKDKLGGMTRFGMSSHRLPRDVLDAEIQRILDLGITVVTGKKIGVDIPLAELEKKHDAVFLGLGVQNSTPLDAQGANAPNCMSGLAFLSAFNEGQLRDVPARVLVVGETDIALEVAAVARRLGHIEGGKRQGAEVTIAYGRPLPRVLGDKLEHLLAEGVQIRPSLAPVAVVADDKGRAKALRVVEVERGGKKRPNTECDIECDLIVTATGQSGDFAGMTELDNGSGQMSVDGLYRWAGRPGIFAGGEVLRPLNVNRAVGHGRIAAQVIDQYVRGATMEKRPAFDVYQFDMLAELEQRGLAPEEYHHRQESGTDSASFAIHNFEDRSANLDVPATDLFLGHFAYEPRVERTERPVTAETVLGDFGERITALTEEQVVAEAKRCMSCGSCMECDNCIIYCPKVAVERVPDKQRAVGRYVTTDYAKCVGCHICKDVCPAGYIQMGLERIKT
jgi:glutamate synthase (NADPH) small chain